MTSQNGAYAFHAGLARLYARMRVHTPTRTDTRMHAHTRKNAHTDQYVIPISFPRQQRLHERVSKLRFTYIACVFIPRVKFLPKVI